MRLLAGFTAIILLLATISFASVAISNTGCPKSTSSLGSITLTGDCSITTTTTWENGTITIAGDIIVDEPLTLRDVTIIFDPSSDFQYSLILWNDFDMDGGGIESTNSNHWNVRTAFGALITIRNGAFDRGTMDLSNGGGSLIENNVFSNVDLLNAFDQTGMRVGSNSTVRWNLFDDYWLYGGAGIVMYDQWGNTKIWGNELRLRCFGLNCMGIENYGIHDGIIPIKPGFPTIEIAWNNITWLEIASGTNSASYDNEYSKRLYIHNNTQTNLAANPVTSPLEMGGVIDSILENNTVNGPSIYGVYQYIYSNAGSIIQYNTFDNVQYGGILQSGYNTYRHNTYTNVANAGQWFCPNSPCAGSSAITAGNQFYNNSYSFKTPSPSSGIVRGDLSNYLDQSFLVHGSVNYWNHGTYSGDSLFWADQTISQMKWENMGSFRRTSMTFGGTTIWDDIPGAGTNGVLTVDGAISQTGSLDPSATFLGAMDRDFTSVTVDATGTVTFTVDDFFADTQYTVSVDGGLVTTFNTDATGYGSFDLDFASQHLVEIAGEAPPPPSEDLTIIVRRIATDEMSAVGHYNTSDVPIDLLVDGSVAASGLTSYNGDYWFVDIPVSDGQAVQTCVATACSPVNTVPDYTPSPIGPPGFIYAEDTRFMLDGQPIFLFGPDESNAFVYSMIASGVMGWGNPEAYWGNNQLFPDGPETKVTKRDGTPVSSFDELWEEFFRYYLHFKQEGDPFNPPLNLLRIWIIPYNFGGYEMYDSWVNGEPYFYDSLDSLLYWAERADVYIVPILGHNDEPPNNEFYNTGSALYQNHVAWVRDIMQRYDSNPRVAMWDLWNEADVNNGEYWNPIGGVYAYIDWVTQYISDVRDYSQNHLITVGHGLTSAQYFFNNSPGFSVLRHYLFNDIPGLDVAHQHSYFSSEDQYLIDWQSDWHRALGIPHYEGEYGNNDAGGTHPLGYGYWPWFTERALNAGLDSWAALSPMVLVDHGRGAYADYPLTDIASLPDYPSVPSDAIIDLVVVDSGTYYTLLQWTAPDNATMYSVRFSVAFIDDGNFDSATPLAVGLPDPGTLQYLNVTGLVAGTQYWFAIKWYDGASWSSISNVIFLATEP